MFVDVAGDVRQCQQCIRGNGDRGSLAEGLS
jgi:hypothetical protein